MKNIHGILTFMPFRGPMCIIGLCVVFFLPGHGQVKPGFQLYGSYGAESVNNSYKTVGLDAFVVADCWFYAGSFSYLSATLNTFSERSHDTIYSAIPVNETITTSLYSVTDRYTITNRFEYFFSSGFNIALTANYAHENVWLPYSYSYAYRPRPAPTRWDTTYNFNIGKGNNYLVPGVEFSIFNEADKFGAGLVYTTDFQGLNNVQPYVLYTSNPYRRFIVKATAGGLWDSTFSPFVQARFSYQLTIDLEISTILMGARRTFIYDIFDRYTNFYREKNEFLMGATFIYQAWEGTKLFLGAKFDKNDRFSMGIVTLGAYIEP